MLIYKITNIQTNKIYFGKTTTSIEKRWNLHLKHAFKERRKTRLCNSIRKHGQENFHIKAIYENISSVDEQNKLEIAYIAENNTTDPNIGYNVTKGGDGGFTDEMRRKSAVVRKQRGITKDHINALKRGRQRAGYRKKTESEKLILSEKMKQYYKDNPDHLDNITKINKQKAKHGSAHHMWGKTHSKQTRAAMSKTRKGKTYEKIYGITQAEAIRSNKRKLVGIKNSNYNNIDEALIRLLCENPRMLRSELGDILKCSGPTLTKRFKSLLNIDNLQKFRYNRGSNDLRKYFNQKLKDYLNG